MIYARLLTAAELSGNFETPAGAVVYRGATRSIICCGFELPAHIRMSLLCHSRSDESASIALAVFAGAAKLQAVTPTPTLADLIAFHARGAQACEEYAQTPGGDAAKFKDIAKHYRGRAEWHRAAITLLESFKC